MMLKKSYMPLPRLILPFCTGIVVYLVGGLTVPQVLLQWGAAALLIISVLMIKASRDGGGFDWLYGLMIFILLFLAGHMHAQQHDQQLDAHHFSHHTRPGGHLLVRVIEPVSERTNVYRTIVKVEMLGDDSLVYLTSGKLMVYFEKDSAVSSIRYGDVLVINNRYDPLSPPQNPNAFDYRRYLSRKNIFHSAYVQSGHWYFTGERSGHFIVRWALFFRAKALEVFHENHLSGREFAVVSALLLGYREYLDDDLRREFAGAGAMHVLCVSGLHVGIIFMVLKSLFSLLNRLPGGAFLRTICIVAFIWLYAAITGFSPSVLRASVMFSFVAVGQSFNRRTNIYNTLAASAFVLVIADPFIITLIGFQLSYLAVISIVALQPPLYDLLKIRNNLLDKAWSIITVSIAAQAATGPLAIYYFNQFPNYFLLTNLVVIPLSGGIIYASLLTLALSPIPYAGVLMGKLLSYVVAIMHHAVRFIEGLPSSTTTGVYISLPETILVFAILIAMCMFLLHEKRSALLLTLALLALLMASYSMRSVSNASQHHFVVYNASRATAVDFFAGPELTMLACNNMIGDPRKQAFTVVGHRLRQGHKKATYQVPLASEDTLTVTKYWGRKGDFIFFDNKTMLLIDSPEAVSKYSRMGDDVLIDYVLIVQNPRVKIGTLLKTLRPGLVIIDASNSLWNASRWVGECHDAGVQVWNVRTQGAYASQKNTKKH